MLLTTKTRIYRLIHYKNLPFVLGNGLYCPNCDPKDPEYITIGFRHIINDRGNKKVEVEPGGVLNDYIPFYFCNKSPMLYTIHKGNVKEYVGTQEELVYLVSNVEEVVHAGIPYVFFDRHAKIQYAQPFNKYEDLSQLKWDIINSDQWGRQYGDDRREYKQAEFLVHNYLPVSLIKGIITHNEQINTIVKQGIEKQGLNIQSIVRKDFYF